MNKKIILSVLITFLITVTISASCFYVYNLQKINSNLEKEKQSKIETQVEIPAVESSSQVSKLEAALKVEYVGANRYFVDIFNNPILNFSEIEKVIDTSETISSFYTNYSSNNADLIYLSTNNYIQGETNTDPIQNINNIYEYNLKTNQKKLIYTTTEQVKFIQIEANESNNQLGEYRYEPNTPILYHTLGTDGDKLVLMKSIIDYSPGPCFNILYDWDKFVYLDLNNPSSGLKTYQLPDYLVISETEKVTKREQCMNQLFYNFAK